jgi:nucleotide-binding universal stress UspA family protein
MILICYDGSPSAKHAISVAQGALGHKPATVLYVWQLPSEFLAPDWYGSIGAPVGPPIAEFERLALERAEAVAQRGLELARTVGFAVDARAEVSRGSVWKTVIDVAEDVGSEVIVVGARGLSTVKSMLLGSVSNAVVHHSHVPVLVVPPPDQTHETRGAP